MYILDFFLEFQSIEWSYVTPDCKSTKVITQFLLISIDIEISIC